MTGKVVEAVLIPIGPFNPTGYDTSKRKSPKQIIKCPLCQKEMSRESFRSTCLRCEQPLIDPAGEGITIIT
jgi:uncharacterized CHY-type Zn-finger protein